jgi:hypothetical protein
MSGKNEAAFWRAFRAEAALLAQLTASGQMRRVFDRVETLLQEHGLDFCFDLTQDGEAAMLILTPEGDREQAKRIDDLLEKRPDIAGWRFFGRRQRKTIDDAFVFVRRIWGCDISDATFDVEPSGEVTLYSKGLQGFDTDTTDGVIATFLDHALGESVAMSRVTGVTGATEGIGRYSAEAMVRFVLGH